MNLRLWKRRDGHLSLVVVVVLAAGLGVLWLTSATSVRHLADNLIAAYLMVWGIYAVLSKVPREELQKRFILMTASLVSVLLLLEVPAWLRFIDYREIFSTSGYTVWRKPGYVLDEELLWVHQPHYELQMNYTRGNIGEYLCLPPGDPQTFHLKYDRNGFRNQPTLAAADIAVIGDSYVESLMIPDSALLTSVLGQLENGTVANFGVAGYGPQQELAVLKRYALPLHPRTVIWVFYEGNDLVDAGLYDELRASLTTGSSAVEATVERSFSKNALAALLRTSQTCTPHPDVEKRYGTVRDKDGKEVRTYFLDPGRPLLPEDLVALDKTRRALAEAYRLCRERGIRFVVVFAPTTFRVYHGLARLIDVSDEIKRWVINDLPERLRTILADIAPDIDYVDLTPWMKAEAEKGTQVFLADDSHWTQDGHRLVAKALHDATGSHAHVAKRSGGHAKADRVIDLARDALMVRAPDGTIRYWNKGAEQLYGWAPKETLGKSSHVLLKTIFPESLRNIEAELNRTGRWEGELVHKRRDGSQVIVASRWELRRNGTTSVVEINSERPRHN
jgi:PAS domain S-box-containing protein